MIHIEYIINIYWRVTMVINKHSNQHRGNSILKTCHGKKNFVTNEPYTSKLIFSA